MNDEQKRKLEQIKNKSTEVISESAYIAKTIEKDAKTRQREMSDIKEAIDNLADALQIKVEITDLAPLLKKLEQISDLPDSFATMKDLASKIHKSLTDEKEIGIKGFRELWELVVNQNNKIDKAHNESIKEVVSKFADLQEYIQSLTLELKQGQDPEDFKPVRLVIGGDGTPLKYLSNMPSSRGGGGGSSSSSSGGLTDAELRASAVPVSVSGGATSAKQDTQITAEQAIQAAVQIMDDWDDGADNAKIVGNVASAATDSGNPVKVGAKFNSTLPTLTNGQRGDLQVTSRGALNVQIGTGSNGATAADATVTNTDGQSTSSVGNKLEVVNRNYVYNGTSFDRQRGDATDGTLVNLGTNNDVSLNSGTNVVGTVGVHNVSSTPGDGLSNTSINVMGTAGGTVVHGRILNQVFNGSTWDRQRGDTTGTDIHVIPKTTGGWSVGNFTSGDTYTALTNSAQVIKGSAGAFGGYYIYNPNSSATYVLVYDIAAASVTVGTSTAKLVFSIPATSGANLEIAAGIPFATAMSIAAATTGGGNGAPTTALEAMVWYV